MLDVDAQGLQPCESRFGVGCAGLLVAPLVVLLLSQFLRVTLATGSRGQVGGVEPDTPTVSLPLLVVPIHRCSRSLRDAYARWR